MGSPMASLVATLLVAFMSLSLPFETTANYAYSSPPPPPKKLPPSPSPPHHPYKTTMESIERISEKLMSLRQRKKLDR
ncbi:hypothetical protein CRG98_022103 [Punica granatum]|uniref:Extensin-like n=1 Tax=Punica granatum TaxID=22663 RepID=A0A2I0JME6_PUNGR|nr:hypothetical protein CRG98_022103 [Punica granatum]